MFPHLQAMWQAEIAIICVVKCEKSRSRCVAADWKHGITYSVIAPVLSIPSGFRAWNTLRRQHGWKWLQFSRSAWFSWGFALCLTATMTLSDEEVGELSICNGGMRLKNE